MAQASIDWFAVAMRATANETQYKKSMLSTINQRSGFQVLMFRPAHAKKIPTSATALITKA